MMELNELIQSSGMLLDGAGAYLIMKGFKNIEPETIQEVSEKSFGVDRKFREMLLEQKADGYYGGLLLIIGFLLMFFASFGKSFGLFMNHISTDIIVVVYTFIVGLLIVYFKLIIPNAVRKYHKQATKNASFICQ